MVPVDKKTTLSIAIPVYNGADHLRSFADELIPVLDRLPLEPLRSWELIFADDGSSDGTFDVIKSLNRQDSRIRGCRLKENRGQQNALFAGLNLCKGRFIATMDDDGQHPAEKLSEMMSLLNQGNQLVFMVNRDRARPAILRVGTMLTGIFFRLFCGKPSGLEIGSFRMMTHEVLEKLIPIRGSFVYVSAQILRSLSKRERREKVISRRYERPDEKAKPSQIGNGSPSRFRPRLMRPSRFRPRLMRPSRFTIMKRVAVFARLFLYYGPFRVLAPRKGSPYELEEIL